MWRILDFLLYNKSCRHNNRPFTLKTYFVKDNREVEILNTERVYTNQRPKIMHFTFTITTLMFNFALNFNLHCILVCALVEVCAL